MDLESALYKTIVAVDPADLRAFWVRHVQAAAAHEPDSGYAVDLSEDLAHSDPIALWARVMLINVLMAGRQLEAWVETHGWNQMLFELAASYPLPAGLNGLDPQEFVRQLETRS